MFLIKQYHLKFKRLFVIVTSDNQKDKIHLNEEVRLISNMKKTIFFVVLKYLSQQKLYQNKTQFSKNQSDQFKSTKKNQTIMNHSYPNRIKISKELYQDSNNQNSYKQTQSLKQVMSASLNFQDFELVNKKPKKKTNHCPESDQFSLQYHQIKKLGLKVDKKKLMIGNWSTEENILYLQFLKENKNDFISEQQRRKKKVFYRLSKLLKKRTPDQCRSHHQKLHMKFEQNIEKIIECIQKKLKRRESTQPENFNNELGPNVQITHPTLSLSFSDMIKPRTLEEGAFFRILQKSEKQFSLQILIDKIKIWS